MIEEKIQIEERRIFELLYLNQKANKQTTLNFTFKAQILIYKAPLKP
jgi:hypothetical protein